ncbi:diguanylate cyclase [Escherichia coli]
MSKQSQHVLIALPHPLLHLVSLGLVSFIFTLFSLELSQFGTQLAPLWFPTSIMMVAFYRHAGRMWPGIALSCSLGNIAASILLFSTSSLNMTWTTINIVEAVVGAVLLRKLLPWYNPLQNLADWLRLALGSAIVPPLLGGVLVVLLTPGDDPLRAFLIWVLSESIGALALVPLGLLFKPHYLLRHRNPRLLFESLLTLAITLTLSWLSMLYLPWPFTFIIVLLMWSAVRLPRMEAFLIFLTTVMMVSLMMAADPSLLATPRTYLMSHMPWLPFLLILLPANIMTMVMYAFRAERKHISESETHFRNAMEYSAIGMALVGTEGQWLQTNKALCQFLGYSQEELRGLTFQQLTWPEDLNKDLQQVEKLISGEINTYSMEKRYYNRNGDVVWALLAVSLVRHTDGTPLYFIAQIEDINELKRTEQVNQQLMERITLANEAGGIGTWEWELKPNIFSWDKRMFELYEIPPHIKPNWQVWYECVLPEDRQHAEKVIRDSLQSRSPFKLEFRITVKDGIRHIRALANRVLNKEGEVERLLGSNIGSVLVIQDVTESRKMLRQLSYSASHDALTHLANRASFEKQLRILLQTVNSTHQRHALVFIDLDRFKAVNDSAGHAAGDALLRELASLMLSMLRSSDVLARLGGDEFGLLLPDCNVESARFIATRIISAVNDYHFIWEGRVHRVGASAGITLIDDNNHQAAEVMSQADIACYASKNGGRGRVTVYEPQQAAAHSERAAMSLDEQWRMIKENQLMMLAHGVASPRIPEARNLWLISLKLWSCEGEIIDEQTFRRSFSDPALSHALDRRVFHEFFQQAAKAVASKGISISLPLSVAGLSSATLVNDLLEQLENSPLPPRLLHLIIPAEAILDHAESVQKLRLAGCRIVLSQVGRDLQIFNSLKANMADYLLLDGELCANVQGNLMDEMLITIIQGHAQRLGMKTIAGPVVLPLVMDTLSGIGVDLIYGEVIADAQPLDLLVNSSYFAIN